MAKHRADEIHARYMRQRTLVEHAWTLSGSIVFSKTGLSPAAFVFEEQSEKLKAIRYSLAWIPTSDPLHEAVHEAIRLHEELATHAYWTGEILKESMIRLRKLARKMELAGFGILDDEPAGDREREIFDMLKGVGLQRKEIAHRLGVSDESGITTRQLTPMKKRGLIAWKRGVGFYRPDCPPPALA